MTFEFAAPTRIIFGEGRLAECAPLAAEGVFAFFLESTFMGLYLWGRGRVPRGLHWFSSLMVAVGATTS